MDELYQIWEDEREAGVTSEEFEDWYSSKCANAEDNHDMER